MANLNKYETKFLENYQQLDERQKLAVDMTEGPVLFLAGPGAGKTHVLTLRVANIIRQTDTPPESILALTYTETAASNMKQRLTNFLGNKAYNLKIATFHGFCNDLIQSDPETFQFTKELTQIDELTKYQLLTDTLTNNLSNSLNNLNNPSLYLKDIIRSISNLKKANVTPEKYQEICLKHLETFNTQAETNQSGKNKGKIKASWLSYQKNIAKNQDFARIYESYQQTLTENGYYDYEDMLGFVNTQLQSNPDFLAKIQEKYLYTLVDEYQDTNGAQLDLLLNINSYDDNPNLFVVGDEDQSIFSFQGANITNMTTFKQHYPEAQIITTKYNYRSSQNILDLASSSIKNNPDRVSNYFPEVVKELMAVEINNKKDSSISLINHDNNYQETSYIASKISELLDQGTKPEEIAVIYRRHSDAESLITALRNKQIPVSAQTGNNLLSIPAIQRLVSLFELTTDPNNSELLAQVMHFSNWKISYLHLFKTLTEYNRRENRALSLFECILDDEFIKRIATNDPIELQQFRESILRFSALAPVYPVKDFFLEVLNTTGFLREAINNNDFTELANYNTLLKFIETRTKLKETYRLANLLTDFAAAKNNKISLEAPNLSNNQQAVKFMTAHSAKGLEFPYVFVLKLIDKSWGNNTAHDKLALLDINEFSPINTSTNKDSRTAEDRRLFYVTITRAKQHLSLNYANKYLSETQNTERNTTVSQYINELDKSKYNLIDATKIEPDLSLELLRSSDWNVLDSEEIKEYLTAQVAKYSLSFSGFYDYQECPRRFLYNHLLKIPQTRKPAMALGSLLHSVLDDFAKADRQGKKLSLDQLLTNFKNYLNKEQFPDQIAEQLELEATKILSNYYPKLLTFSGCFVASEFKINNLAYLEEIPLTGKIDAILKTADYKDFDPQVEILDYKTAAPISENALLGKTPSSQGKPHKYYSQLCFYNLLMSLVPQQKFSVQQSSIEFLKPISGKTELITRSFSIPSNQIDETSAQIKQVYSQIKNLEFSQACHQENCAICTLLDFSESN